LPTERGKGKKPNQSECARERTPALIGIGVEKGGGKEGGAILDVIPIEKNLPDYEEKKKGKAVHCL